MIYNLIVFLVTTTEPTTIQSTTVGSTTHDICPLCSKTDWIVQPMVLSLPPVEVRSGNWHDCKHICLMNWESCTYFTFFSQEIDGPFKNQCFLFKRKMDDGHYMKGVISGKNFH